MSRPADLLARLVARGETVAVAESLTGGLLASALVEVPGASRAFRGGVVAYATDLKGSLLGVPRELLERHGPVHPATAEAMAAGVRERLRASYGVATTGVAGPDPQDGVAVGTVCVAVAGAAGVLGETHRFTGGRAAVRVQAVAAALELLARALES